ncbi:MAG: type II toxin-antitoxin system YoeB family toxin [Chitinophagales bacterium]|nr:type II toxin-antitoxin system YoeB family toxin [Chitinophagales bacterium]
MNDSLFNELSVPPPLPTTRQEAQQYVAELLQLCKEMQKKLSIKKMRFVQPLEIIYLCDGYSLKDYINDRGVRKDYKDLLLNLFWYPFIDDNDETALNQYVERQYWFQDKTATGLAVAHIYNTVAVSMPTDPCWDITQIAIRIIDTDASERAETVLHCSKIQHLSNPHLISWQRNKLSAQNFNAANLSYLYPTYRFEATAIEDMFYWYKHNPQLYEKLHILLRDIANHPFSGGLGQTEVLRQDAGVCSKRLNREHRLTYRPITENNQPIIKILRCKGHYE